MPSRIWGSGFFVAPGWVITCAHVLIHGGRPQVRGGAAGMRITGSTVGITFNDGAGYVTVPGIVECVLPESYGRESLSRDAAGPAPAPDLALIRLLEPVEHPCVWLSDRSTAVCDRLAYFGCSEQLGEVQDFSGHSVWSGTLGRDGLFRLGNTDEVPEGVSGGPVVDLLRGEVIGVVKARRRDQDGGLAVAVSQLRRLPMPATEAEGTAMDLYVEVLRAHDRYHHERHSDPADGRITWIDAQALLVSTDIGQLNPARRAEMLALLTRIPSPRPGTVSDLVRTVREDDWSSPSPVPAPATGGTARAGSTTHPADPPNWSPSWATAPGSPPPKTRRPNRRPPRHCGGGWTASRATKCSIGACADASGTSTTRPGSGSRPPMEPRDRWNRIRRRNPASGWN